MRSNDTDSLHESRPGYNYKAHILVQIPQPHRSSAYISLPHMYGYSFVPGLNWTPPQTPIQIYQTPTHFFQAPTHMIETTYELNRMLHNLIQNYESAESAHPTEKYRVSKQDSEPATSKYQSFWPADTYGSKNIVARKYTPEPTEHAIISNFLYSPRTSDLHFIINRSITMYIGSPKNTYDFNYAEAYFRYRTILFNSVRQALNYQMILHTHGESSAMTIYKKTTFRNSYRTPKRTVG
uniref:Astacin domain-containing protein n=1 Tax=Parastrongyloides trichosuri TaxID=131310 RepID=A0A0N4ZXQ0_PARTI